MPTILLAAASAAAAVLAPTPPAVRPGLPGFAAPVPVVVDGVACHPSRLIVRLTPGVEAAAEAAGARIAARWPQIGWGVAETAPARLREVRATLARAGHRAELDRAAFPAYTPNDPLFGEMWHATALRLPQAWDLSFGSEVVVAVMDTGVNLDHPDLAANAWTNPAEVAGNGLDDDGNGWVDDVHGIDSAYGDADPDDVHGHGTACAGLVAATMDNGIAVAGPAPRARVMALKSSTDAGYFYDSANIPAYLYAADHGARVLSGSFYSDRVSAAERDALQYAVDRGVLPVIAAGNDQTVYPYYPAAYRFCLSVAALDTNLNRAGFSNYGLRVDVAAPGVSLRTTTRTGGTTAGFAGTSGACPQVAGIAALAMGANPALSARRVREILEDTAVPVTSSSLGDIANYGRIDAEAAVAAALADAAAPKTPVARAVSPRFGAGARTGRGGTVHRIYGRGFDAARTVRVTAGGRDWPVTRVSRDELAVAGGPVRVPVSLVVDGQTVATWNPAPGPGVLFAAIELAAPGASRTGAADRLALADGQSVTVGRRSDNRFLVQATFADVDPAGVYELLVDRTYANPAGTERIQLYRWTSASYPYGGFDTFAEAAATASPAGLRIPIADIRPYLDDEATAYFRLLTENVTAGDAQVRVDRVALRRIR